MSKTILNLSSWFAKIKMKKIKYNAELMRIMSLFETLTHTKLRDCFVDSNGLLLFFVNDVNLRRSIGKQGQNVKRLEKLLNRKIKIVGFTPHLIDFVKNLVYPWKVKEIKEENGLITITGADTHSKALLIGKNGKNAKNNLLIVQRYFNHVENLKVI